MSHGVEPHRRGWRVSNDEGSRLDVRSPVRLIKEGNSAMAESQRRAESPIGSMVHSGGCRETSYRGSAVGILDGDSGACRGSGQVPPSQVHTPAHGSGRAGESPAPSEGQETSRTTGVTEREEALARILYYASHSDGYSPRWATAGDKARWWHMARTAIHAFDDGLI